MPLAVPAQSQGASPDEPKLTAALIRQKISQRLGGSLSPEGLASWAKTEWLKVQRGIPADPAQRDQLEEALQCLVLSTTTAGRLTDEQLVDLMTELDR